MRLARVNRKFAQGVSDSKARGGSASAAEAGGVVTQIGAGGLDRAGMTPVVHRSVRAPLAYLLISVEGVRAVVSGVRD